MIIDVKEVKFPFMWCMEKAFATIATYLGRNYEMSFSELWNFDLAPEIKQSDNVIGNKILINKNYERICNLFEKFHGIKMNEYNLSQEEVFNILYEENRRGKLPLTQLITPYFLWDSSKTEIPGGHNTILMITGFSNNNNIVHCIDLHNNRYGEIAKETLLCSCKNCISYELTGNEVVDIKYTNILDEVVNKFTSSEHYSDSISAMFHLADLVERHLDINLEVDPNNVFNNSLIYKFDLLMRTRGLFSLTTRFISNKTNIVALKQISDKLETVSNTWDLISKICIKEAYRSVKTDIRILLSIKIKEAAELEMSIMNDMKNIINNRVCINKYNDNNELCFSNNSDKQGQYIHIDMRNVYNNKGFCIDINDTKADFTGMGEYFYLNDDFQIGNPWRVGNMEFYMPLFDESLNDNVSCEGQRIDIPLGKYGAIAILGCSEWGNFTGKLTLNYDDNQTETIMLKFSDWYGSNGEPYYGEDIAWTGESIDCKGEINRNRIYASNYRIMNNNSQIKSILLPQCPNMHIFAISLLEIE